VALVGSLFASLTARHAIEAVRASRLPGSLRETAVAAIRAEGSGFRVPKGASVADAATLHHALASGITDALRPSLLVAAGFLVAGTFLSLLLPRTPPPRGAREPLAESLAVLEPVAPDPAAASRDR
jgi:hypothetical protein